MYEFVSSSHFLLCFRYKFFSSIAYNLGGRVFSLNDVENGVLRANRASMGTLYMRPFAANDPRLMFTLPECEPRLVIGGELRVFIGKVTEIRRNSCQNY